VGPEAVVGSFKHVEKVITFECKQVRKDVFEVKLELNGKTLTTIINYADSEHKTDGFTTKDRSTTTLTDEDRELISALGKALAKEELAYIPPNDPKTRRPPEKEAGPVLVKNLILWFNLPLTAELRNEVKWETEHSVHPICGYLTDDFLQATHDCAEYDRWDDWHYVNPGPTTQICYPNANGCGEDKRDWQYGDQYGNCAEWETGNNYTRDCLEYDHCTRNHGHRLTSYWCADEYMAAADDILVYRSCPMKNGCRGYCGGYSREGCWCDSLCESYGDCCNDKHSSCG
jgi:hypothetical protein